FVQLAVDGHQSTHQNASIFEIHAVFELLAALEEPAKVCDLHLPPRTFKKLLDELFKLGVLPVTPLVDLFLHRILYVVAGSEHDHTLDIRVMDGHALNGHAPAFMRSRVHDLRNFRIHNAAAKT